MRSKALYAHVARNLAQKHALKRQEKIMYEMEYFNFSYNFLINFVYYFLGTNLLM